MSGRRDGASYNRNVRTMPINWSPIDHERDVLRVERGVEDNGSRAQLDAHQSRSRAPDAGTVPATPASTRARSRARPQGTITALSPSPRNISVLWAGTDDGNIQMTSNGGATWTNVTPPQIKPWTRIFNIEAGHFDDAHGVRSRQHAAHRRSESALLAHARWRQELDGDRQRASRRARSRTRSARIRA